MTRNGACKLLIRQGDVRRGSGGIDTWGEEGEVKDVAEGRPLTHTGGSRGRGRGDGIEVTGGKVSEERKGGGVTSEGEREVDQGFERTAPEVQGACGAPQTWVLHPSHGKRKFMGGAGCRNTQGFRGAAPLGHPSRLDKNISCLIEISI